MENTIIIFYDLSDPNNPGWAWRNDEESGQIDSEDAAEFLCNLANNEASPESGRDALVSEMLLAGHEIEECYLSIVGRKDIALA